jgi:L,D-peptidoglycan transpeptidase YkuD (ErfK/YbiS/YcfS/YnhG family)
MLDILESQGVISKIEDKFKGAGKKSGKISRIEKAQKWTDFSKGVVEDGMELGRKGLDMFNKQKDRNTPMGQLKRAFGGNVNKRPPSPWILHVKSYAQKHSIPYKQALKEASPSYKSMKAKN